MERRSSLMARDWSEMYTISLSLLAALHSSPREGRGYEGSQKLLDHRKWTWLLSQWCQIPATR